MTLVSGQCDNATLTKLALRTTYEVNLNKEIIINFLNRIKVVCYKCNDGSLSYKRYNKVVVVVK